MSKKYTVGAITADAVSWVALTLLGVGVFIALPLLLIGSELASGVMTALAIALIVFIFALVISSWNFEVHNE